MERAPGSLVSAVKRSFAEAALPRELAHPHALWHTFALEFLRRQGNRSGEGGGDDLNNLRELLGHADLRTTSVYARPPAAEIEAAFEGASKPLTQLDADVDR
jgi:site-specific recombinase XerD